ncbi:MAG: hypothetical protein U1F43_00095 [Myxococcota bacterium]
MSRPAIALMPARALRRLIRSERHVGGFGRDVPHAHGWVRLEPDGDRLLLPDDVDDPRERWRRAYGLAVLAAFQRLQQDGALPRAAIRERIHHLGQVEVDEVRAVLRKERRMLPPLASETRDGLTWSLFAALWAELETFDALALEHTFPTLSGRAVRALLERDVPLGELLAATRPDDAATLAPERPWREPEPTQTEVHRARLLAKAERAERQGDELRALRALAKTGADVHEREARLRARVEPLLDGIMADALAPDASTVERVARKKLVSELVDRLIEKGRIDFPALRDAVSRNAAKLADLRPRDALFDPLLAADKRVAQALRGPGTWLTGRAGPHRRAEVYRRALHHLSALAFGTRIGRLATKLAIIPALGAWGFLEAVQHTIGLLIHLATGVELELVTWPAIVVLALVIFGLVNLAAFRRGALTALKVARNGLRTVFVTFPRWLFTRPWLVALVRSPPVRALWRFVLEPALIALPFALPLALGLFDLPPPSRVGAVVVLFALALVVLRSPLGDRLEDALTDSAVAIRRAITRHFIPALVTWVIAVFKALVELVERGLHAVDELLRVEPGSSRLRTVLLVAVGLPWRALAYVARLYLNVFIEPKYNPLKHFPAVTIGHTLILPLWVPLTHAFEAALAPLGPTLATTIAATTVFVLPGLFGFLVWELKENWRLYAANRPATLRPVVIGSHGESMRRLLVPGFHSGTLPKLFAKLRRAAGRRDAAGRARRLRALEAQREHVAHAVADFMARDVLAFVPASTPPVRPEVELASNRISVALGPVTITFEEQSGLVLADARGPVDAALAHALDGAWRKAAVDLLRRDLAARADGAPYDVDERGDGPVLVVWPGPGYAREEVKPLDDLRLALRPLSWRDWVAGWP